MDKEATVKVELARQTNLGTCVLAYVHISGLRPSDEIFIESEYVAKQGKGVLEQAIFLMPRNGGINVRTISSVVWDPATQKNMEVKFKIWLEEGEVKIEEEPPPESKRQPKKKKSAKKSAHIL